MKIYDEKLGDILKNHPELLNFIARLEIPLGFGDVTISEICKKYQISAPFFTELLQLIIKKYNFNPNYIDEFEPKLTIKYLYKSHESFIHEYLSDIENLIINIKDEEGYKEKDCFLLLNFFKDYKMEFLEHLSYEDKNIYPYILDLETALNSQEFSEDFKTKIRTNPIKNYVKIHSSLDDKLNDLKSLIIKFFKPYKSTKKIRDLIKLIFELEEDLKLHELIENKILFAQAEKMEKKLMNHFEI